MIIGGDHDAERVLVGRLEEVLIAGTVWGKEGEEEGEGKCIEERTESTGWVREEGTGV